jgi:hypothetical protein
MDWIERVFHIDPDGGSGVAEIIILAAAVIVVVSAVLRLAVRAARCRAVTPNAEE